MSIPEFERLIAALIPDQGRAAVTLTEPPRDQAALLRLLDAALTLGAGRGAPLRAIHAPFALFPHLDDRFWHVPIEDSSAEGVVRLTFEAPDLAEAA